MSGYTSRPAPLRYPAGFVYVYSILYYATGHGKSVAMAQVIFSGLYLLNLTVVLKIYCNVAQVSTLQDYLALLSKFLCTCPGVDILIMEEEV